MLIANMVKPIQIFIPMLWLVPLTLAEPPLVDGYATARSSHEDHDHDHHGSDHQRPLSQEYGPPNSASARGTQSTEYEYNPPNARGSNARGQSRFPPATVRVSFNQRFGPKARSSSQGQTAPATRSGSQEHSATNIQREISQEYGTPASRSPSQEYGTPSITSARTFSSGSSVANSRSSPSNEYGPPAARALSQEYGTPSVTSARTLSTEYGMPDARSSPSEEYGVPTVDARSNQKLTSATLGAQAANHVTQGHSTAAARSQFQTDSLSHGYNAPKPFTKSGTISYSNPSSQMISHGVPSTRNMGSLGYESQKGHSETFGANVRSLSQEYGVPSSHEHLMTSAISTSYSSARLSPSSAYVPASRSAPPSKLYGVPNVLDGISQGYDYARARALEELQNQEPASYDFGYQIEDQESGSDFGHSETRENDSAQGSYFVVLPDGAKQTVEYEADEGGYKPRISVEPAGYGGAAGIRSDQGPY